jgi:RNA polymerase sigma-70 factor (ECF subfamily)
MASTDTHALDQSDMARLAAGQDAALNDLMDRHAAPVFQFLCRMTGDEEDAADLAQEVFVRVYRHRGNYRADHKFTTWLYTIATNLARNHAAWRARRPNVSLEAQRTEDGGTLADALPSAQPTPGDDTEAAERARAVRAAVAELPDDMRAALLLFEFEDKSLAEVGDTLGISVKAVESRLFRARQRLREKLSRWLQTP